jgi:alkylation response protein AidB-like acyl-CoA dehydrogenase
MDFALSEEQEAIFDMARAFGEAEIAPHARDWDKAGDSPRTCGRSWRSWASAGFT